jgi:hypothetical protein
LQLKPVTAMSSNHLNMYIVRNAKGLSSLETLCTTMFGPKKGKFNQRQQLQYLREMSIYLSTVASIDEAVFTGIVAYLKELGDSDADRKLFRTAVFLLVECISHYCARGELTSKRNTVYNIITQFEKELKHKTWSSRQILMWRSLGTISHLPKIAHIPGAAEPNGTPNVSEVGSSISTRLLTTFEELQYPVKQKKSMLFGDDKDFMPKLMSWAAVASGLVRSGDAVPRKSWENLHSALNCTRYKPLAQHAHRLLFNTAKQLKDSKEQLEFIHVLLSDHEGDKAKDAVFASDPICGTYYIRTLAVLAHHCRKLQQLPIAAGTQLSAQAEIIRLLISLFASALRHLDSK